MKNQKYRLKIKKNQKKTLFIDRSGEWAVELVGEGAEVKVLGVMRGEKDSQLCLKLLVQHRAPKTKSDVLVKAVATGTAAIDFNGKIKIGKNAQLSTTFLRTQTLILSDKAKANCRPQLEIEANEIKAGHAATIGKIDEEQIFYLMSRGLERRRCEQLIIEGFLREVIERVKDKEISN